MHQSLGAAGLPGYLGHAGEIVPFAEKEPLRAREYPLLHAAVAALPAFFVVLVFHLVFNNQLNDLLNANIIPFADIPLLIPSFFADFRHPFSILFSNFILSG